MIYYKILINGELLMVSGVNNIRKVFQELAELGEASKQPDSLSITLINEGEALNLMMEIMKEEEGVEKNK